MNPRCIVLMVVILFIALWTFKKDYYNGLALCVGLLVSLPDYLRLSFGGGIPELTVHRMLLVLMLAKWWKERKKFQPPLEIPFKNLFLALGASQVVSLVFSSNPMGSVKAVFVFALEIFSFYVILSTSLRDRASITKMLYGVAFGLAGVAIIAGYERRYEVNLSRTWVLGMDWPDEDITATYPHRIVLGYAMAMAVPIILVVKEQAPSKKAKKILFWLMALSAAGCYFANSRGPWIGLGAATVPLIILGSKETKKMFVMMMFLGIFVLIIRPGVRDTLANRYYETFYDKDSLKGKSYEYRWILWHVAKTEIAKDPERLLFGYGGLSTEKMDLSRYFDKESGGNTALTGFTSWDNQMACDLIELGYVGFILELILLAAVLQKLGVLWWHTRGPDRNFVLAFFSTCAIYAYALSNVYIFSPQLKCLFWTLVACGVRFGQMANQPQKAVVGTANRTIRTPLPPEWSRAPR